MKLIQSMRNCRHFSPSFKQKFPHNYQATSQHSQMVFTALFFPAPHRLESSRCSFALPIGALSLNANCESFPAYVVLFCSYLRLSLECRGCTCWEPYMMMDYECESCCCCCFMLSNFGERLGRRVKWSCSLPHNSISVQM